MICKKCKTENKDSAIHCLNCGYELVKPSIKKVLPLYSILFLIIVALVIALFYSSENRLSNEITLTPLITYEEAKEMPDSPQPSKIKTPNFEKIIFSFENSTSTTAQVYVTKQNLMAIPVELLKDIKTINFSDALGQVTITKALWNPDDPIIFFVFPLRSVIENTKTTPFLISQWSPSSNSYILSANSNQQFKIESLNIIEKRGNLLLAEFQNRIPDTTSIIIQNNNLVGWVFPKYKKNTAFLWLGETHIDPIDSHPITLTLASLIFADEKNVPNLISSLPTQTILQDFCLLIDFISVNNIRDKQLLSKASNIAFLYCNNLIAKGFTSDVASNLTSTVIAKLENEKIMKDFALAIVQTFGYPKAIVQLRDIITMKVSSENFDKIANDLIGNLYCDWIELLLEHNDNNKALDIYDSAAKEFSDNQKLSLLGAEIYLKFNSPDEAQKTLDNQIFDSRNYSAVETLRKKISAIKALNGKISIKFDRNSSSSILLDATLNNSVKQRFIVDTGATLVSIPSETAKALRINPANTREKLISTANGVFLAKEVYLNSIIINGKRVSNVQAVIIDLPDDKGLGLLGMSFLDKFKVELDNRSGELLLTPKEIN